MHTFDVYWLWLCLCVVLVLLYGTKTKQQLFGVFLHIVCKNQKLYFSGSFRSVESFDPSCFFLASSFPDGTAAVTTKTMTQNNNGFSNTAFDELPVLSSLIFAGLVVILVLLYFRTEFVFIVADRREVLCLVHRIEPKRQGFTLPLLVEFRSLFFQPNVNFPSLFLNLNRFPLFGVTCILRILPVCLVVSEFRFG